MQDTINRRSNVSAYRDLVKMQQEHAKYVEETIIYLEAIVFLAQ